MKRKKKKRTPKKTDGRKDKLEDGFGEGRRGRARISIRIVQESRSSRSPTIYGRRKRGINDLQKKKKNRKNFKVKKKKRDKI